MLNWFKASNRVEMDSRNQRIYLTVEDHFIYDMIGILRILFIAFRTELIAIYGIQFSISKNATTKI